MYAKIFTQIFDSSIADDFMVRHVFMDLLVLADSDGVVDMTHAAISRRTNVPLETVCNAIVTLEKRDEHSRAKEFDGVRIKRLDDHRDWGWIIVNYDRYRKIATEESRREHTRDRVRKHRELHKDKAKESKPENNAGVTPCNAGVTKSNDKEKEKEKEKDIEKYSKDVGKSGADEPLPTSKVSDDAWLESLKSDKTYEGIDVGREYGKMLQWCATNHKQPSRRRFVNWINRAEKPINGALPGNGRRIAPKNGEF